MPGVARSAPPAFLGFDCLTPLPLDVLKAARAEGFRWHACYLEVATPEYIDRCHSADLWIALIGEARVSQLGADVGTLDGDRDAARALALGAPATMHLTVDFEDAHGSIAECDAYLRANTRRIALARFGAQLYVAPPEPLDGIALYALPDVHAYWHGGGDAPAIACGYTTFQGLPLEWKPDWASGYAVDPDVIFRDLRGRTPVLWAPT